MARPDESYPRTTDEEGLARAGTKTRALIALWEARRAGRLAPARADLSESDLAPFTWGLTEVEVVDFPDTLVYRAISPRNAYMRGRDPAEIIGRTVRDAYFGRSYDAVLTNYRLAVEGRVVLDTDHHMATSGYYRESETLFLPLSRDGRRVDRLLIYTEVEPVA